MNFIFATNNSHKLEEVRHILTGMTILSLSDVKVFTEIPEDFQTLEENALQKARFIYALKGGNILADDTGLEIEALNGKPGVYSARYAGEGCSFADNVKKVLEEMQSVSNRRAVFRTVVAMIFQEKEYLFEGVIHGSIISEGRGNAGFGYDPVFIPDGHNLTFAQMPLDLKNKLSHRALAFGKVSDFLIKIF